jgi:hypothetical protein
VTAENPQLRAIAIAGALAVVAVLLGMWTLNRQQPSATDTPLPPVTHRAPVSHAKPVAKPAAKPAKHVTPVAAKPAKHVKPVAAKPVAAKPVAAKPVAKPVAKPKPRAPQVSPFEKAALAAGLPKPVARQFAGHEVVVVTLYSPDDDVDRVAEAEARSGAALGGAGFVALDVSKNAQTADLTKLLGVLTAPSSLVFARADIAKPVLTLDGFADRQTVAQAAVNADPTPGGPVAQSAWARKADALCLRTATEFASISGISTPTQLKAATPKAKLLVDRLVAGLEKLPPPPGRAADVTRFVGLAKQDATLTFQAAAAAARKDPATVASVTAREAPVAAEASTLAVSLGAASCARPY